MPQSAIATGLVDLVLPPAKMAAALVEVVRHPYVRQPEPVEQPELDGHLSQMLALLRSETKLDFQPYRRQTLLRRTHRRMGLHQIGTLGEYLQRLRADPQEVNALARDLTINVSGFFRDPEAWRVLDEKGAHTTGARARSELGDPHVGTGLRHRRRGLFARDAVLRPRR